MLDKEEFVTARNFLNHQMLPDKIETGQLEMYLFLHNLLVQVAVKIDAIQANLSSLDKLQNQE